jgi:hypothetical protein
VEGEEEEASVDEMEAEQVPEGESSLVPTPPEGEGWVRSVGEWHVVWENGREIVVEGL